MDNNDELSVIIDNYTFRIVDKTNYKDKNT